MPNSEEWEVQHLTSTGWVAGSYRHIPWLEVEVDAPQSGVLTVRRHIAAIYAGPSRITEDRTPHTEDIGLIESLLAQFGNPKFSF